MKPKFDLSQNMRQDYVAILLIIWKMYIRLVKQALPIIIALAVSKKASQYIWYVVIVVNVLIFVLAIWSYFRFYFRVENDELIVEKGIFKRTKLNIPFERIQSVNFEQNIALQVFQKYKVEVDTAGSSKKEFSFDALDKSIAHELRRRILSFKQQQEVDTAEEQEETLVEQPKEQVILELSPLDLLKIGLTENHLKAAAFIFAIVGYLFNIAHDAGVKIEDTIEDGIRQSTGFDWSLLWYILPFVLIFLIAFSIGRIFLTFFNLKFIRTAGGFKIYHGLLNRKEYSAPDNKIQKVVWRDNPLRRIFGLFSMDLKQAKSGNSEKKQNFFLPIKNIDDVHRSLHYLHPEVIDKPMFAFKSTVHLFKRNFLYIVLLPALIGVVWFIYTANYMGLILVLLYMIYFTLTTWVQYKKRRFIFNDSLLQIKRGVYANIHELIPWYKIQGIEIVQSIYQRRHQLASIHLYTAAGAIKIPFISLEQAQQLGNFALYKAEISNKSWM